MIGFSWFRRAIDILTTLSESDEVNSDFILNTGAGMLVKSMRKCCFFHCLVYFPKAAPFTTLRPDRLPWLQARIPTRGSEKKLSS
jgi:hypothetical protein